MGGPLALSPYPAKKHFLAGLRGPQKTRPLCRSPLPLSAGPNSLRQQLRNGGGTTRAPYLALPDDENSPPVPPQDPLNPDITLNISQKLLPPELRIALRRCRNRASRVSVPETPVHQYNGPMLSEDNIGLPWKIPDVNSKSQSKSVQSAAHRQFRARIAVPNPGHSRGSLLPCQEVCHRGLSLRTCRAGA